MASIAKQSFYKSHLRGLRPRKKQRNLPGLCAPGCCTATLVLMYFSRSPPFLECSSNCCLRHFQYRFTVRRNHRPSKLKSHPPPLPPSNRVFHELKGTMRRENGSRLDRVLNGSPFIIIPIRYVKKYLNKVPLSWKCINL